MGFIIIVSIVIYAILITWCWNNLGRIKKSKKIAYIFIGIFIIYVITNIVYGISKSGIQYPEEQMEKIIGNVLVLVFSGLNGLITLPYIAKQLDKAFEKEIEKEKFLKKVILIICIFVICLFIECGYLKDAQTGILKIYNTLKQG